MKTYNRTVYAGYSAHRIPVYFKVRYFINGILEYMETVKAGDPSVYRGKHYDNMTPWVNGREEPVNLNAVYSNLNVHCTGEKPPEPVSTFSLGEVKTILGGSVTRNQTYSIETHVETQNGRAVIEDPRIKENQWLELYCRNEENPPVIESVEDGKVTIKTLEDSGLDVKVKIYDYQEIADVPAEPTTKTADELKAFFGVDELPTVNKIIIAQYTVDFAGQPLASVKVDDLKADDLIDFQPMYGIPDDQHEEIAYADIEYEGHSDGVLFVKAHGEAPSKSVNIITRITKTKEMI